MVAVKVFVEQDKVFPVPVAGVSRVPVVQCPMAILVGGEKSNDAVFNFRCDFVKGHHLAGTGRAFDSHRVAVELVISPKCLDQKKIQRQPNRSPPIRVAAKHWRFRFTGGIFHIEFFVARFEHEGFLLMNL